MAAKKDPGYRPPAPPPKAPSAPDSSPLRDQISKLAAAIEGLSRAAGMGRPRPGGEASPPDDSDRTFPRAVASAAARVASSAGTPTRPTAPFGPAPGPGQKWQQAADAVANSKRPTRPVGPDDLGMGRNPGRGGRRTPPPPPPPPGGGTTPPSGSTPPPRGGARRRTLGEMTDDEVIARMAKIHGRIPKGFDASQVHRFEGRVDWRATNAAYRRTQRDEDEGHGRSFSPGKSFFSRLGRNSFHGPDEEFVRTLNRIMPEAIARPVTAAFERTRGWRELSNSFGNLARDAREAGKPLMAAAARVLGVGSVAGGVISGVVGAGVGAVKAGYRVGQNQMDVMRQLAPYNAKLVGEVVSLEMSRFRRNVDRADAVSETGAALMRSRDFLEQSLLKGQSALDNIKNQVGTVAFGAIGFGANVLTRALGIGEGGAGGANAFHLGMIRHMGGLGPNGELPRAAPANPARQAAGNAMLGAMPGIGPMFALGGILGGALGNGGNRPDHARFRDNLDWIEENAPEMAAALQIPSLLMGMAGIFGAFGPAGKDGWEAGVQKAIEVGRQQVEGQQQAAAGHHNAWMQAFGAIAAGAVMHDRDAHGPVWDVGPGVLGEAIREEAARARFWRGARRARRNAARQALNVAN